MLVGVSIFLVSRTHRRVDDKSPITYHPLSLTCQDWYDMISFNSAIVTLSNDHFPTSSPWSCTHDDSHGTSFSGIPWQDGIHECGPA